jgi:imidazolonepropionase-like amidohydrolase
LVAELELLQAGGFSARELLTMATLTAASVVGRDGDLGSVTVGKRADLVLVDGDPLTDLTTLRKVRAVIRDGTLYSDMDKLRAELPLLLPRR